MHNVDMALLWFVAPFVVLVSVLWLYWVSSSRSRVDEDRVRFETYWAGRDDIAAKLIARAAWQARGAATGSMSAVEILASLTGILGAVLLAIPHVHPTWGFAAFLASNLAAIPFNKRQGNRWILLQQRFFLLSSLFGLWNWWLGPLVLG